MFEPLSLPGLILVTPKRHGDARGYLRETWQKARYAEGGITHDFVQDNHSYSAAPGTIRGLHFQRPPAAQAKLVTCIRGRIWDVAVDLRAGSATYGQHQGVTLDAETGAQLFVPEGFAHGFCTLEPDCEISYKMSAAYAPDLDAGLAWDDPDLAIDWPIHRDGPTLSDRDHGHPPFGTFSSPFRTDG